MLIAAGDGRRINAITYTPSLDRQDLITNWKSWLHLVSEKNSRHDLEGQSRSLTVEQFSKQHIALY